MSQKSDVDIGRRKSQYQWAIIRAREAIRIERTLPRIVPPLCAVGLMLTVSWGGLWHAVAPGPARLGTLATLAALGVAAAFAPSSRTKTVLVSRRDALRRLDENEESRSFIAQTLSDRAADSGDLSAQAIVDLHIERLWQKRDKPFIAGRPKSDMNRRDPYHLRHVIAAGMVLSGVFAGVNGTMSKDLRDAFNWATPVVPVPMLDAEAWIRPPEKIRQEELHLNQTSKEKDLNGLVLQTHQYSVMTLLVYGKETQVTLNGKVVPLQTAILPQQGSTDKPTYQYEIKLIQNADIEVAGGPKWHIDVPVDLPPRISITGIGVNPKDKKRLDIDYLPWDDHGLVIKKLEIVPEEKPDPKATPLPSAELPHLDLP